MTARVAHRGDSSRFRENTLAAIRSAVRRGASTVEIDVRLTADGRVVVLHDPTLERLWGDPRPVRELAWEEVAGLGGGELRIPLLDEVLEVLDGSGALLLIDMDHAEPAAPAWHRVQASAADVRIAWCGDTDGMRAVRALDAEAEVWQAWARPEPPTAEELVELAPAVVNLQHLLASEDLVQAVHALGARVSCWTVNDAGQVAWLTALGVDSITTDRLDVFVEAAAVDPAEPAAELYRAALIAGLLARAAIERTRAGELGEVRAKANPADHVTEIDTAVERMVRAVVGAQFPRHAFVGEEYGGRHEPDRPCWFLDPVDGTANLANGVPWTSFSLALVVDGAPVIGVVADPWLGDVIEARAGAGARLNGESLVLAHAEAAADVDPLRARIVSTELAGHRPWPGMIALLDGLAARYCTMRVMGSGTLTITGVALGRGVGAVIGAFGPVDHLAAVLIVREAGGVVLDEQGQDTLFPAIGGVLAARDRETAQELHALWRSALANPGG